MTIITDTFAIAEDYDLFILDLFGVIHDGTDLYPNSQETVKKLRKLNKKICFLSNAPRRASRAIEKLTEFGINEGEDYDAIITSGEYAYSCFSKQDMMNYFYFGPEKDRDLLKGLGHKETSVESADIAVSTGLEPHENVDSVTNELAAIKARNLELYCINPDLFVHKKCGKSHICAGSIALKYQEMGGKVKYFGKPHLGIYESVFSLFPAIKKDKILAVGDGMHTDIKGAEQAQIDSLLISSGMHRKFLGLEIGEVASPNKISSLIEKYKTTPKFISSLF